MKFMYKISNYIYILNILNKDKTMYTKLFFFTSTISNIEVSEPDNAINNLNKGNESTAGLSSKKSNKSI